MNDKDIRARILGDVHSKIRRGEPILQAAAEYAKLLGISDALATFNIKYLLEKELLQGKVEWSQIGDLVTVTGISPRGIDAIDGVGREAYAVNFNLINVEAPVTNSQFSIGNVDSPSQNRLDSSGSTGSTSVIGNQNVIKDVSGPPPVNVHPYSDQAYGYI